MTAAPRIPRGIRNNNPMNLRSGSQLWNGQTGADDLGFCQFASPEDGIRAGAKVLIAYEQKHGLNTIRGIIGRWAPPSENDTGAYAAHVAEVLGVGLDEPLKIADADRLRLLVRVITLHECGSCPYDYHVIDEGVARALAS